MQNDRRGTTALKEVKEERRQGSSRGILFWKKGNQSLPLRDGEERMGENRQEQVVRGPVSGSSGRRGFNCSAEQDRRPAEGHGGLASDAVGDGGRSQLGIKKNCPSRGRP